MSDIVLREEHGPVLVIELNDPERANPLSSAMVVALSEALERAASDADLRAVVLTATKRRIAPIRSCCVTSSNSSSDTPS